MATKQEIVVEFTDMNGADGQVVFKGNFPETLQEAIEHWGEDAILHRFNQMLSIRMKALASFRLRGGKDAMEIQQELDSFGISS